jgi:peptide/nickel transport system substrate-binding protein
MKKVVVSLLLLTLPLVLAGAATAGEKVLMFGTDSEPIGFDPHTIPAVASSRMIFQMYNTLVNTDENLRVIPELAKSWEQPDDLTYIFHLRDDVKFHSGRKMTAEDVKYSFERMLDPVVGALASSPTYAGNIETVEAVDDYTVKIKLSKITAPFLANIALPYCSIVDREVVEKNGNLLRADGGTGAYTLGEWIPDNRVVLHKFDDYFVDGEPLIDRIEYYVMTDSSARLAALRTGRVDVINADISMLPLVKSDANIETVFYQSLNYSTLCLNTTLDKFKDVRVRQAISLAADRQEIIDSAYSGEAEISGFVPTSMGHWAIDVTSHPLYRQDIEKAKELMAAAGYENGFEVTVIVGLLDSLRDIGTVVQQQLAAIGLKINVVNKENAEYVDLWRAHDFEIMVCQNGAGFTPSRGVEFFFKTGATANIAEYSNPRVDELCDLAAATVDEAKREVYYKEAIGIILDECPNVVIASPREYFMTSSKVKNFAPSVTNPYRLYKVDIEQ